MEKIERRVRREVRAMTRREVITKAIAKQLTWVQATEIVGVTPRQMRRIRWRVEQYGLDRHGPAPWATAPQADQGRHYRAAVPAQAG